MSKNQENTTHKTKISTVKSIEFVNAGRDLTDEQADIANKLIEYAASCGRRIDMIIFSN